MARVSAGILLHRWVGGALEVLLVHPGGPFWVKKDAGAWSIPKGVVEPGEDPENTALRELLEETGWAIDGARTSLGSIRQKSGKIVRAWTVAADVDPSTLVSNTLEIVWPPRSGRRITIPEVDRAAWFDLPTSRAKINEGQVPLLDRLEATLR